MAREPISKKLRFEVFKRDKFTCQYCGRAAPDVLLHVDHLQPVAEDGTNDILNLITACRDCNLGKGSRELSDDSAVIKQKKQLDELQERREQLQLMVEWQRGLIDLDMDTACELACFWNEMVPGYETDMPRVEYIRHMLKKYSAPEILSAIRISTSTYLRYDDDGDYTEASVHKAWEYIERICAVNRRAQKRPWLHDCYYIKGILRNRFPHIVEWKVMRLLEKACELGIQTDELKHMATVCESWKMWQNDMQALIDSVPAEEE